MRQSDGSGVHISVLLLCMWALTNNVDGHRPLLRDTASPSQFGTWEDALTVPWITNSWSFNVVTSCRYMTTYFKVTSKKPGTQLYIGAGVQDADGLADVKLNAVVFGPGFNGTTEVEGPPDMGALVLLGPNDTSTCDFLESSTSIRAYRVHDGRCAYYERWGGAWIYSLLDRNITLPEKGEYVVAIQPKRAASARYFIAPGDWEQREEFWTPYSPPTGLFKHNYRDSDAEMHCCELSNSGGGGGRKLKDGITFDDCAPLPV